MFDRYQWRTTDHSAGIGNWARQVSTGSDSLVPQPHGNRRWVNRSEDINWSLHLLPADRTSARLRDYQHLWNRYYGDSGKSNDISAVAKTDSAIGTTNQRVNTTLCVLRARYEAMDRIAVIDLQLVCREIVDQLSWLTKVKNLSRRTKMQKNGWLNWNWHSRNTIGST